VISSAAVEHLVSIANHPPYSAAQDAPIQQYISLCDVGLRTWPSFNELWNPNAPATTVRQGTVVPGQIVQASDGASFIRVVTTAKEDSAANVYCFLPLHGNEDPSDILLREYQRGEAIAGCEARLLADQDQTGTMQSHQIICERYTVNQDLTFRSSAQFGAKLPVCPPTTVAAGGGVFGQVVVGDDHGKHLKIVVVTPPEQGSQHLFCFLPLHAYGDSSRLLLSNSSSITPNPAFVDGESTGDVPESGGGIALVIPSMGLKSPTVDADSQSHLSEESQGGPAGTAERPECVSDESQAPPAVPAQSTSEGLTYEVPVCPFQEPIAPVQSIPDDESSWTSSSSSSSSSSEISWDGPVETAAGAAGSFEACEGAPREDYADDVQCKE